jgi:hypothetical protein
MKMQCAVLRVVYSTNDISGTTMAIDRVPLVIPATSLITPRVGAKVRVELVMLFS